MLRLERKSNHYTGFKTKTWFRNKETEARYKRVVGGLAWPSIRPGFAVILAEDWDEDPHLKARHFRLLAEAEEGEIQEILEWCRVMHVNSSEAHWCWYGERNNKPAMSFCSRMNRNLYEQGMLGVRIANAPYADDPRGFEFCVNILKEHLRPERKTLHLGEQSALPGYLMNLSSRDIIRASAQDYPAIAAAGYAMAALAVFRYSGLPRED